MSLIRRVTLPAVLVSVACTNPAGPPGAAPVIAALPRPLTAVETEMASAANAFGVTLFKAVNESFADSNVFMSPLSASMALGMTMNGAEGTTFTEMRSTLGFDARTHEELNNAYRSLIDLLRGLDPKVDFKIANAIYHGLSFGPSVEQAFLDESKQFFDAEVKGLDFAAPQSVDVVNDWANRNTNGRIPTILDRIDPDLVMLLMNAIYFKGDWRERFKESDTRNAPFRALRGEVSVPTMHRTGGFRYARSGHATVAELPYGGDAFVMTILMPDEEVNINTFVSQLTSDTWQAATASLHDSEVPFSMPKFRMAWEDTLNNELRALGMRRAFQPDHAEFTRISRNTGNHLYIDFVKQKAFVDVNEAGTEAAAVTVVGIMPTSMPQPVDINRPFVFVIRERLSGTVLFIGKIVEPKLAD